MSMFNKYCLIRNEPDIICVSSWIENRLDGINKTGDGRNFPDNISDILILAKSSHASSMHVCHDLNCMYDILEKDNCFPLRMFMAWPEVNPWEFCTHRNRVPILFHNAIPCIAVLFSLLYFLDYFIWLLVCTFFLSCW